MQRIVMPKKDEYEIFKNYKRKIRSPFIIYADFESILGPEDNEKQNPEESYLHKQISKRYCLQFSCGYKLACADDKFTFLKNLSFKTYLGKNAVYSFINNMIEESKYCSEAMKKYFNKELLMTEEDNEDFKNYTNSWICDNDYINKSYNKLQNSCRSFQPKEL